MEDCKVCKGYGFLLIEEEGRGLEIQRCDNCREITDEAAIKSVFELARAALDVRDLLVLYHRENDTETDFFDFFKTTATAVNSLHGRKSPE